MYDDVARVFLPLFQNKQRSRETEQCQGEREICMSVQIKGRGKLRTHRYMWEDLSYDSRSEGV